VLGPVGFTLFRWKELLDEFERSNSIGGNWLLRAVVGIVLKLNSGIQAGLLRSC
jgi:hypothetical protein